MQIESAGGYGWKDYAFQADITIDPKEFEVLLSGRRFSNVSGDHNTDRNSVAGLIEEHVSFVVESVWDWSKPPMEPKLGDYGPQCKVYADQNRQRALIIYGAD